MTVLILHRIDQTVCPEVISRRRIDNLLAVRADFSGPILRACRNTGNAQSL
ncbi:hypothetical protein SDC9_180064 [bioreactor metagenome]|uniref:Uncharacterized protein n=1 Tax=bioreactor metagenome TaxID=1076179 RepID=A0A645H8I8_9ZZZZ